MPRRRPDGLTPSWSALCRLAAPQHGYFNRTQAQTAGYSRQLMQYYIQKSLVERTERDGVFHLTHIVPAKSLADRVGLIVLWLTTDRSCVFSHETALWLHGLIDRPPEPPKLTLPLEWRRRRLPDGVICHIEALPEACLDRINNLPVTTPLRALTECLLRDLSVITAPEPLVPEPDAALRKAITRAVQRGLLTRAGLKKYLAERRQMLLGGGRHSMSGSRA